MRVPEELIYALLRSEKVSVNDVVVKHGGIRNLMNYLIPEKTDMQYVALRTLTVLGFMGMGKTVFASHIAKRVKEGFREKGDDVLLVSGKSIVDIIHYLKDNHDLIKHKGLFLFVDDVLYQGLAREATRAKNLAEKYYSDVRHKFESLGFTKGILYVVFAGQRLKLIPPFFRNSPFLVFKPLVINDPYETETVIEALSNDNTEFSRTYAHVTLAILEASARIAFLKWDETVKSLTVIKPAWDHPYIYVQTEAPKPEEVFDVSVEFNYSGIYEAENGDPVRETVKNLRKQMKKEMLQALYKVVTGLRPDLTTFTDVMNLLRELGIRADQNVALEAWRTFTTDTTKHNSPEFSIQRKTKQIYVMQT
ncbi:MAG: hypothetical protein QXZ63_06735 [Sulfolobales archaeon]